jgi:hypothetical protein
LLASCYSIDLSAIEFRQRLIVNIAVNVCSHGIRLDAYMSEFCEIGNTLLRYCSSRAYCLYMSISHKLVRA